MSVYTIGELDTIHQMMRTYRQHNDNPTLADAVYSAVIIDEDGNEYEFQHSHSDDLQHGRPLPQDIRDCPRSGSIIDSLTGECADSCRYQHDCALGYSCVKGHCLREKCSKDSDCSSGKCENKVCQPLKCSDTTNGPPSSMVALQLPHGKFSPYPAMSDVCVSTSHYNLRGRDYVPDLRKDPRYAGMFN